MSVKTLGAPVVVTLCLSVAGCGDDETVNPAPTGGQGGVGTGGSGGSAGETTGGAGGDAVPQPPGLPEPLHVANWKVAFVSASLDPVPAAIDEGTMTVPTDDYLGLTWLDVTPGPEGQLVDSAFTDYIYAVAEVNVPDGHHVFARGDTVSSFIVDNAVRQPGDIYASKNIRVPLETTEGAGLVVVRALGRRGTPEVELWSTTGEVEINTLDATLPDLVVGKADVLPLGIPLLILEDEPAADVVAEVVESDAFEASTVTFSSLAPHAVTQLSFELVPKAAWTTPDEMVEVTVRVSGPTLDWTYEKTLELRTRTETQAYRLTRRSNVDGSTQYMGVLPPTDLSQPSYGLMLSLHGASVQAIGQAEAYSNKDWAYLVAPTNRRPFGFDWEEWGRLDAIEALDFSLAHFPIDPLRVHLTGHSMGGHGSWHVGAHFGHRFGFVGPSAGWISFETYTGPPHPTGPIGRARAASQTLDFVNNYANNSVYIVHGSADDNVPVGQAQQMFATLTPIVSDLTYHEELGARHWWDIDAMEPGADCVDWEPMVDLMEQRTIDATPLTFDWTSPGPWVNPDHSFVHLLAATSPMENVNVTSAVNGNTLEIATTNVRGMELDGAGILAQGITDLTVDGQSVALISGAVTVGLTDGKTPEQYGPLNQVFHKPFCFVWDDDGPAAYRHYAAYLLSSWSVIGNGHGCGVPLSRVGDVSDDHNLVFLGVASADLPGQPTLPIDWSANGITIGNLDHDGAVAFVYPDGDRLAGYFSAVPGKEYLLFRYAMFSSRSGMPDWLAWGDAGLTATGFFNATWQLEPSFSTGL